MGQLPMPARAAKESARSHKVFIMLLPDCNPFPPLQSDIISIYGEDCALEQGHQTAEKWAKSPPRFPAHVRSLSRCVTKIRGLALSADNRIKTYIIVNAPFNRFLAQEIEKIAGVKNEG